MKVMTLVGKNEVIEMEKSLKNVDVKVVTIKSGDGQRFIKFKEVVKG